MFFMQIKPCIPQQSQDQSVLFEKTKAWEGLGPWLTDEADLAFATLVSQYLQTVLINIPFFPYIIICPEPLAWRTVLKKEILKDV